MAPQTFVSYTTSTLMLILWLSMPPIVVAVVVGVTVSLLQALTQVQDQTLSFGFKLIAVTLVIVFFGAVMADGLYLLALDLFDTFYLKFRR
jgi:type III secretion protein S